MPRIRLIFRFDALFQCDCILMKKVNQTINRKIIFKSLILIFIIYIYKLIEQLKVLFD
jgi:hypothetical protein